MQSMSYNHVFNKISNYLLECFFPGKICKLKLTGIFILFRKIKKFSCIKKQKSKKNFPKKFLQLEQMAKMFTKDVYGNKKQCIRNVALTKTSTDVPQMVF